MQENLKIVLIQADLVWENPKQNRENFTKKIENISEEEVWLLKKITNIITAFCLLKPPDIFQLIINDIPSRLLVRIKFIPLAPKRLLLTIKVGKFAL